MPFLLAHPAIAWLLPAIGLPILFHLFFRLRRQVREFPSLMFFLRIDPRLSAKRKIHEWLILFLRCLLIALLLLALARPLLDRGGSGGSVARLILIDNSGSMASLTPSGVSKMTLAERAAEKLVAACRPGDATAVQLMIPDSTATVPSGFDASPVLVRDALDKLTPSDGGASVPRAVRLALAMLTTAKAPQRELHILTDLQRTNWSEGGMDGQAMAFAGRIMIHRLTTAPVTTGSVSIEPGEVPTRALPAGRITPVRFDLQNHGPGTAHVRLNSVDDSGKSFSREVTVAPHATTPVVLTFSFANPGFHWAQAWVEGDVAPTATRADLGFWCTEVEKVLFVGTPDDFAALPYAVSPGGNASLSGINAVFINAGHVAESLGTKPLAMVLTWEEWPQDGAAAQALEDYVRQGGTLFLVPRPGTGIVLARATPAWLEANPGVLHVAKEAEPMMLLQNGDALWHDLRDAEGRPSLGRLRAFQYRPLQTGADWQILVASGPGSTLLARRNFGLGRIFASGLTFTPQASSLPLKAGFVVLVQNAVFGGGIQAVPVRSQTAGEPFQFDFPGGEATLKSLAGSALDWRGQARDFAGFTQAGIYEIDQQNHVNWAAISGKSAEADPDFLPLGPVPLLRSVPHEVVALNNENDVLLTEAAQNSGTSLYRWLLLAALLVLLAETWLANERSSDLGRKLFASLLPTPRRKSSSPKRTIPA